MNDVLHGLPMWYLNRGSGTALVVVLTVSVALGIFATARATSVRWPRFATQTLHRNVSLLALVLLAVHAASPVIHAYVYVPITWLDTLVPFLGKWQPLGLGIGTLACDLMLVVVITSLVRHRFGHRTWRSIHLLSYAAWGLGVLHGVLVGTDARTTWGIAVTALSVGVVVMFVVLRLATLSHERRIEV